MTDTPNTKPSEAALEIAESLFTNGSGSKAERLVLWQDTTQRDLGGWCRAAVADRIDAALARAREDARREVEERERAESQRAIDGVRRLLEDAQREAAAWKPYRFHKDDNERALVISLRFSRLALKSYRGDPRELIWKALQRVPDDAIRALGRATPTPQGESRVDQKRPPPPEDLVDALQDRVHPASGPLIQSKPVTPQGETKEND